MRLALAVTLFCTVAWAPLARAQTDGGVITADDLHEDFRVFRTALEESHAGLYWYVTPDQLGQSLQAALDTLDRPMTAREFYRLLLPVVGALGHGHTTLTLPTRGVGYRLRSLDAARAYLPFAVRVLDDRLYVSADLSDGADVAAGSEILAIDGRPVPELLGTMRPLVSADGFSQTYRDFRLGPYFEFHALLDLLYGPADTLTVDLLPLAGGAVAHRRFAAAGPARMVERFQERTGDGIDTYPPILQFTTLGDRAALLTVRSFYEGRLGAGSPSFEAFFDSTFREIRERGVTDLVVDVRGNEGGNDYYAPLLYSYLADRPFVLPQTPMTVASASLSSFPYAESPSEVVQAFAASPTDFVDRQPDGTWALRPEFDENRYRTHEPAPDAFTGRLYVLTDGGSFSATTGFLDLVYYYHRAASRSIQFVGEQSGGDTVLGLSTGGQQVRVVLPHSGLQLSVPLLGSVRYFASAEPPARIPDYAVAPSVLDMVDGTDRALVFVRDLIARAQGTP